MAINYATKLALDFPCGSFVFLSANGLYADLSSENYEIINKSHIYCIASVPKATINPNSLCYEIVKHDAKRVLKLTFDILYSIDGVLLKHQVDISPDSGNIIELRDNETAIRVSNYPYLDLQLIDSESVITRAINTNTLAIPLQLKDLIDFKILYIGQAYGKDDGNRNAFDRLKNHEKLQKALAEFGATKPDKTIMIGVFEFGDPNVITFADGKDKTAVGGEQDITRALRAMNHKISKKDQISIIEAALIRYFQPEYNEKLKKDLPSKSSKTLSPAYEYDFNSIGVAFFTDTDHSVIFTYSDVVDKKYEHTVNIELYDLEDRKSFFSFDDQNFEPFNTIRHKTKSK